MTSEVLKILISSDAPYLQLSTFGHNGSTYVCLVVYVTCSDVRYVIY